MSSLKICPQCGAEYPLDVRFCQTDGTPLRTQGAENDLVGSIIAERYHVLRKLGEGGMGQVYLAEHVRMGRKSALKVMNSGMSKDVDAITRFNREAANASRISHPNVAAVYDFGETPDGVIYLAMEFVDGPPLTKVIESQGSLPPQRAAEIVRQAADALAVAHDMGIVHRDLKPDNIMLASTRDGGDLVKVVDFGIAKAAGADAQKVTRTGLVVGTPEYMSPEQLAGDKLDGRSDIYSLALVAFNMLTGKLPFPSDSTQESMIMRLTDKPQPLGTMKPDISWSPEVQRVMDRALERQASARYATAPEFARDLVRAVGAMPDSAARDAGTQVIAAPVAKATGTPVQSAAQQPTAVVQIPGGVQVPATRISSAAGSAGGKRGMLWVGIGVVAAAAIAVGFFALHPKPASTQQPSTSAIADSTPTTTQAAVPAGTQPTTAPATGVQGKPADAPAGTTKPNAPAAASPAASESQLAALDSTVKESDSPATANSTLAKLAALTYATNDLKAHAEFVRFRAYENLNEMDKACPHLANATALTTQPSLAVKWKQYGEGICPAGS